MSSRRDAIGVIDSGIGGFSVARRIRETLPHENMIYLGDCANMPYGNRSSDELITLAGRMMRFMERNHVKALLVACNTTSCLLDRLAGNVTCRMFSVIEAGAEAVRILAAERVTVVSTCFTANSGCYPKMIHRLSPETEVISCGCPNLAAAAEKCAGRPELRDELDDTIMREFGGLADADGFCLLGCTHYPLAEENIRRLFPSLKLIDPAERMAAALKEYLAENDLENDSDSDGRVEIFSTADDTSKFAESAVNVGLIGPVRTVHIDGCSFERYC